MWIPIAVLHRQSSDFCILWTFYTLQNLISWEPDFLFVTIHFKVCTYILNCLCFWFLFFICQFFGRGKKKEFFYSHKYIWSRSVLIFRLNFWSIFSLPKSCNFTFKQGRRKKERIQQDLKLFFFWIVIQHRSIAYFLKCYTSVSRLQGALMHCISTVLQSKSQTGYD